MNHTSYAITVGLILFCLDVLTSHADKTVNAYSAQFFALGLLSIITFCIVVMCAADALTALGVAL